MNDQPQWAQPLDADHRAAIVWSQIAEGGDPMATQVTSALGYEAGLDAVRAQGALGDDAERAAERWRTRLDGLPEFDQRSLERLGITIVIPGDEWWPEALDDLGLERPTVLWVRGAPEVLRSSSIAIVGSRAASNYGLRIATDMAFDLCPRYTIVSGGAFGIDAAAHRGALLAEGRTVIVSAGGVGRPYPQAHADLFNDVIAKGGAVISESPLGAAPQRHRFLSRNRIIAALGQATVVIEAPIRSGALATARRAIDIGREVCAVPGPITAVSSAGCHQLIRDGATLVTSAADVVEVVEPIGFQTEIDLGRTFTEPDVTASKDGPVPTRPPGLDPLSDRVWEALPKVKHAPASSVARVAGLTIPEAMAALGRLALAGHAESNEGMWRRGGNLGA